MSGCNNETSAMTELTSSPAVQRWFESAGYRADPIPDQERRLALLGAFCAQEGKTPDELVRACLRTAKSGRTAISAKGRNAMNTSIEEFVTGRLLNGREAIVAGNIIRGFLIHNGVFIQGPAWTGG
jgi:hypothetical protein